MPAFIELLEPTKSEPCGAIEFTPCEDAADRFVIGVLTITGKRCHARYTVAEFSPGCAGRGFVLTKLDRGTDGTETHYSCLTTAGGLGLLCDCKGATATGRCKHLSSLEVLISNGQV